MDPGRAGSQFTMRPIIGNGIQRLECREENPENDPGDPGAANFHLFNFITLKQTILVCSIQRNSALLMRKY